MSNDLFLTKDKSANQKVWTQDAETIIGNGTFGVVYKAKIAETGETVAIKKVQQDKRYKNRELQIHKELIHPNVIQLKHAFQTRGDKPDEMQLNAVMEQVPDTVSRVIRQYNKNKQNVPMLLVKLQVWQMCRSLAYIHFKGICHRDIKPQNLLINPDTHQLKLCDFGSAKKLVPGEPNVSQICSRQQRAPELIFGATNQSPCIDMWSMGCVFGELLLGRPLFPGDSGVDQLVEIIKVLGTPSKEQILSMNENYSEFKFPQIKPSPWCLVFKRNVSAEALDIISKILVYEPDQRILPLEALSHPFFDELFAESTVLPNGNPLPELFTFTKEELELAAESVAKVIKKLDGYKNNIKSDSSIIEKDNSNKINMD